MRPLGLGIAYHSVGRCAVRVRNSLSSYQCGKVRPLGLGIAYHSVGRCAVRVRRAAESVMQVWLRY